MVPKKGNSEAKVEYSKLRQSIEKTQSGAVGKALRYICTKF